MTVIGRTKAEAEDKYERLQELIQPELGIRNLSAYFGKDLSKYPLDGPVPDPIWANAEHGRLRVMVDLARRENLSIRQLYKRVIGQRAHRTVCDTPAAIADTLAHWFETGAADGFNLLPLTFPQGLDDIVDLLVPELQRRGLFRTEYEGKTLRENLGLPYPENRWAKSARMPVGESVAAS
jgi:alkanesulfonate monooxygenase